MASSPASQKSKDLNKLSLLLQHLDCTKWFSVLRYGIQGNSVSPTSFILHIVINLSILVLKLVELKVKSLN